MRFTQLCIMGTVSCPRVDSGHGLLERQHFFFGDFVMRLALSMAVLALSVSQLAASSSIYVEPASVPPNQFPCSKGYRGRAATGRNRGVGVTRKLASKR